MRAQVAVEFIILVGVVAVAVIMFASISLKEITELQMQREFFLAKDTALMMKTELGLAAQVEDGYRRAFLVPEEIGGKQYSIIVVNETLTVSTARASYTVLIPLFEGNVTKGMNNLTKEGGAIQVNVQ